MPTRTGMQPVSSTTYEEGAVAKTIEHQTAKLPSDIFLWLGGAAAVTAMLLEVTQPKSSRWFNTPTKAGRLSGLVGQWAPSLLLLGVYNKMVKLGGSDRARS
ncbi:MAG: hypothetical protein ABI321_03445 [Polyangia bacterium]